MNHTMNLRRLLPAFLLLLTILPASAKTLRVGEGQPYATIRAALQAAQPHDTVLVSTGLYQEGMLEITQPLSLIARGKAIIDGANEVEMIRVSADSVLVQGFVLQNSGATSLQDIAAIRVMNAQHVKVLDNTLLNNFFGIYLANVKHSLVQGNTLQSQAERETSSGNGIHLWKCKHIDVTGNTVRGHRDGIYLEFVEHSHMRNNLSEVNLRYGLHFMFSDWCSYIRNTFRENGAGVAVMYTKHVLMRQNLFDHNWGSASYGMLLKEINESTIEENVFHENTIAIFMEGSSRLGMRNNIFHSNGWAIKVMSNCLDDTLEHNNFIANTFDIATNGGLNGNIIRNNYWDKYQGYDIDRNGIGDIPYRPVSLFSMIMEKIPNSVMLLRSMVSNILDQVEKVYPDVIPESLADVSPVMKQLPLDMKTAGASGSTLHEKGRKKPPTAPAEHPEEAILPVAHLPKETGVRE